MVSEGIKQINLRTPGEVWQEGEMYVECSEMGLNEGSVAGG